MTNFPNYPTYTPPPPPPPRTPTATPTITVPHQDTTQPSAGNQSTRTTSTTTHTNACAACRFQRRKCSETCPLAPYFPAHNLQQFKNAYKLFGVSNIIKALNSVPPNCRDDAMVALIYTANARANNPVLGCTGIIQSLSSQIAFYNNQLMAVLAKIAAIRASVHHDGPPPFRRDQVQVAEALPLLSSAYFSEVVGHSECRQPWIISNKIQAQQQRRLHKNILQDSEPITDLINEAGTSNQMKLENTVVLKLESTDVQVQNVGAKIKWE